MKHTYLTSEDEIFNLITLMVVEEDVLVPFLDDLLPNEKPFFSKGDCSFYEVNAFRW